jgi:2-polyprenyl-3-methyl-5-hydroxy-6-metoxy-1,4-benzoquinol methylase
MTTTLKTYEDINWPLLRENAMERKGWKNKTPKDWDKKARSFSGRNKHNSYTDLFISHIPLEANSSVLDIGSGPGTLAIPLARKTAAVTAIDFSKVMLVTLNEQAEVEGLQNITT